ncbi:MAG TPA: Gfo/Idh/MocA family oxidoreductase [Candidatus Angelobacter sp.]|nr:Gfo/Idh/MocA family oxidoreductase [Candidatus Angelobacter sp.]
MNSIRIGLIGAGFMGRAHTIAYREVGAVFDLPAAPVLELIAEIDARTATAAARKLGFRRATADWRQLVQDPAVDLVDITAPTAAHREIAIAALAAGKHVYCEKPLALTAAEARGLAARAAKTGVVTMVGFNYLKNPIQALARDIISSGEIGDIIDFRGIHAEDYMISPQAPMTWRCSGPRGSGVVADLGSHIVSLARHLVGPIESVCGTLDTIVKQRPVAAGASRRRRVVSDDQARFLVRFANGSGGTIEASWVTTGRKMQLAYEIAGTKGSLAFTQERMNELKLYTAGQKPGREGYKTIATDPNHPPYGAFCPAPGHQLGFNDMKVIEVRDLLLAVAGKGKAWPDFREAWEIQRVVDAVIRSDAGRRWVRIDEVERRK